MGEAKRRKQKESNYGKDDPRLINLRVPPEVTDPYDDVNVLVGAGGSPVLNRYQPPEELAPKLSGSIRRQIRESASSWQIWHKSRKGTPNGRSLVIVNPPNRIPPILTHHFSDRQYFWQLQDDPEKWRFKTSIPAGLVKTRPPEKWGATEILADMHHWPAVYPPRGERSKGRGYQRLKASIAGHYHGLSLWLEWGEGRNDLEDLVLRTPLSHLRPYYDLSVSLRKLCLNLWSSDVPMALKAATKEHLWYCAEYSLMLGKVRDTNLAGGSKCVDWSKDKVANFNSSEVITPRKEVLRRIEEHWNHNPSLISSVESLNLLTIESLHSQGFDWREWIIWLLVDDGIRHAFKEGDTKLARYCKKFLSDYNHYNRLLSGQDVDERIDPGVNVCMYLNDRHELVISQQHRPLFPLGD